MGGGRGAEYGGGVGMEGVEWRGGEQSSYPAYNSVMAREMRFAPLAAEDLVRVQVDVVR